MPTKLELDVTPSRSFSVPYNAGYQIYSALLNMIKDGDEKLSEKIHDDDVSKLNISKLNGPVGDCDKDYYKSLYDDALYKLQIGIVDSEEEEIFRSFFDNLVLDNKRISLANGDLILKKMKTLEADVTYDDIETKAKLADFGKLCFEFSTTTCIPYRNSSVFEMFPHRIGVFNSLASKWNNFCEEGGVKLDVEDIGKSLIEYPEEDSLQNYPIKVNSFYNEKKGKHESKIINGFKGMCEYRFTGDVSEKVKNELIKLTIFAEFSGVGSAVSRGCGSVKTEVK